MKLFPIHDVAGHWNKELATDLRREGVMLAVVGVPWELIAAHETQCLRNHNLTVEHAASRGGLSAEEACAVIEDRPVKVGILVAQAHEHLATLTRNWIAAQTTEQAA